MGQLEEKDSAEEVSIEEQKKKKQMKVVEELITTETKYCHDISQLLATMQVLEGTQVSTGTGRLKDVASMLTPLIYYTLRKN